MKISFRKEVFKKAQVFWQVHWAIGNLFCTFNLQPYSWWSYKYM